MGIIIILILCAVGYLLYWFCFGALAGHVAKTVISKGTEEGIKNAQKDQSEE